MIDRVQFENFKSLQSVTLHLGRLTALVGANGCGKSSVLQGMHLLSQKARKAPAGRDALADLVSLPPRRLMYRAGTGDMVLSMRNSAGDVLRVERQVDEDEGSLGEVATTYPRTASDEFASVAYLHLDANEMTRTSVAEDEPPAGGDGSNLASALAWMTGAAEDELAQITADLRQVVPGVKRIRTLRERVVQRRMEKLDIDGQPIWRPVERASHR